MVGWYAARQQPRPRRLSSRSVVAIKTASDSGHRRADASAPVSIDATEYVIISRDTRRPQRSITSTFVRTEIVNGVELSRLTAANLCDPADRGYCARRSVTLF